MSEEKLEAARIFKFNRGHLFLGGERPLVLATGTITLVMVVVLQNKVAAIVGVMLWLCLMPVYRLMARHDPVLSVVYRRYAQMQRFYPARSMKLLRWKKDATTRKTVR